MLHQYTHISLDIFKVFDNIFHPYDDYITHNLFFMKLKYDILKKYIYLAC